MSALSDHLDRLVQLLESIGLHRPSLDVRIFEHQHGDFNETDGRYHIRPERLRTVPQYEKRFDELLRVGYTWLNMSCYGVHDNRLLIVAIAPPSSTVPRMTSSGWSEEPRTLHPGCITSVNLSGPPNLVRDKGWDVGAWVAFDADEPTLMG
jgi:hypothetical protein